MHPKGQGQSSHEITYTSKPTVPPLAPSRQGVQPLAKKIMQEYDSSEKREEKTRTKMDIWYKITSKCFKTPQGHHDASYEY
jgi:hypothetical protein